MLLRAIPASTLSPHYCFFSMAMLYFYCYILKNIGLFLKELYMINLINRFSRYITVLIIVLAVFVCILSDCKNLSSIVEILAYIAAPFFLCISFIWNNARIFNLEPEKRKRISASLFTMSGFFSFLVLLIIFLINPYAIKPQFLGCCLGVTGAGLIYAAECEE